MVELPENCPICGKKMEKGTLRSTSGGASTGVFWGPPDWGYWSSKGKKTERIGYGFVKVDLKGFRCAKCNVLVLYYGEEEKFDLAMLIEEEKLPKETREIYEQLLKIHMRFYGGGKIVLESKIESLMNQGLSLEEAIRKLAEKEKLVKKRVISVIKMSRRGSPIKHA